MLRKFKVNINEKEYYVEMEELTSGSSSKAPSTSQSAPSAPQAQPAPAPAPAAPSGNDETLVAPMPGNILKLLVSVGDTVAFEQPLVILEAMKMENELVAPLAGQVKAIHVSEGSSIDVGKPIITIG